MAKKLFRIRLDRHGNCAVKENVAKTYTTTGYSYSVTVGLDSNLCLTPCYIFEDNTMKQIDNPQDYPRGRGKKALYFGIADIYYLATVTVQYNKKGVIKDTKLTVYIPQSVVSRDEIVGNMVTATLSKQAVSDALTPLTEFVQKRI